MFEKTIARIENRIQKVDSIDEKSRGDLLGLLSTLRSEVSDLAKTHGEHAESITGFVDVSMHEAIRREKNPKLLELAIEGLSSSASEIEVSHPRLTEIVNSICLTLSNLGI